MRCPKTHWSYTRNNMKVLLVNKFHYMKGGSETYYFALSEMLTAYGHEVIHFSMSDDKNSYSPTSQYFVKNIDMNTKSKREKIKIMFGSIYSKDAYNKMNELLNKEKPDIVHLGLVHRHLTYSIVKAIREHNIPIVQSVHDMVFVCPSYMMLSKGKVCEKCVNHSKFNCIKNKCVKNSLTKSIFAVAESRYIKKHHFYDMIDVFLTECKFYEAILKKANFCKSRFQTMTNFIPKSKSIVKNDCIGDYYLFFGRFSPEKGIMTLLSAFEKSNSNKKLVIVGDGPLYEEINFVVNNSSKRSLISLKGAVYGKEMEELLANSRAVIVPSEWYENCPYSILESMAKSRVVVCANIGGLPELVIQNKTGFLFKPGDIDELAGLIDSLDKIDNKALLEMQNATYLRACTLSYDKYYKDLISLYNQLIEEKKHA